jgi:hypothetical protein
MENCVPNFTYSSVGMSIAFVGGGDGVMDLQIALQWPFREKTTFRATLI